MADEHELKELINQAITCENPHVYGTVNLNRLREVLCLLVSVRKPYEESFNESLPNQSLDEETESFQEIVREVSKEETTRNSLQGVSNALSSPVEELDENEVEENLNSTCLLPSTEDVEQCCGTRLSLQNISLEIEEVRRKINEINERIFTLETKPPFGRCQCTCNCGVIENAASSSNSNASHAGEILFPKPSTQSNVSESIFDAERDEPLNVTDDLQTICEVVSFKAVEGNSILKSQSAISVLEEVKNKKPVPKDTVVSVEQDNEDINGQHVDEDSSHTVLSHNTKHGKEKMIMVEESVFPKFDELVAAVDGLVEREKMFFERFNNIEKLMSTYIDELYARLQEEKCVPLATGFDDTNIVQNLQQECGMSNVVESVHQSNMVTESSLEANIRGVIEEIQNEIGSLKIAFNRLNIAAGGKTDAETKTHVQCISCNCAVAMKIHEERIPTPVPLHVRRCMKPMLRRQLDWLKKEIRYSTVAPMSIQPYCQLLKQNILLSPK